MTAPAPGYTAAAVAAMRAAVESEPDFAGWLASVLCRVAAGLGSSEALVAARPRCWEADLVLHLVCGTAGWGDEYLADFDQADRDAPGSAS
jgi:hypothetical protein